MLIYVCNTIFFLVRQADPSYRYSDGDGNPKAFNTWKAMRLKVGLFTLILDYLKGAVPVSIVYYVSKITGWGMVVVAIVPVLGHTFSLKFRCGKADVATFGIWTGFTLWQARTR